MERKRALSTLDFFADLDEQDLEEVVALTIERQYDKNQMIFMEGDPGKGFHFVIEGRVKIYKTSRDGKELILTTFGPGSSFAEVTIFNDVPYPATAETLEPSRIGMIRNDDLEGLIAEKPALAIKLIRTLSKKLYRAQLNLKQIALDDTEHRLIRVILDALDESHRSKLTLHLSRQEIGEMIGATRETVSRTLNQLKKDGLIRLSGKTLTVVDEEGLRDRIE